MDERRTLAILAWTVGSVVGAMFLLNGIALSFVDNTATITTKQIATGNAPALHAQAPTARGG